MVATLEQTPPNATHWSRASMASRSPGCRVDDRADLAQVRAQAASGAGRLQALHRSAVRGQGPRRGRALSPPAGVGGGVVRGREVRDAGPGPLPAGAADDAGHARAAQPRLRPARHHEPVRGVQHRRRHRDLRDSTASTGRWSSSKFLVAIDKAVPAELDVHLVCDNLATHKTASDPGLAGPPPPLPPALHPDRLVLDQPGRTLVRVPHRPAPPPRGPQERRRHWRTTSANGSRTGTTTRSRSSGPRPPRRSSTPSPNISRRISDGGH